MALELTINDPPPTRLPERELAAWREIPTAVISDDLGRSSTVQWAIKLFAPSMGFAAQALTIQTMVGDNGIVVIRADQLAGLMEKCRARIAKEEGILKQIAAGTPTVDLLGLPPLGQST